VPASQVGVDTGMRADSDFEILKVGGLKLQYYATCLRRLWLCSHHVTLDSHSRSASRETERGACNEGRRKLSLDGIIEVDVLNDETVVGAKPAGAPVAATRLQLAYYMYYLRRRGLGGLWGELRLLPDGGRKRVRLAARLAAQVEEVVHELPEDV
jgi:CRISPR-associated exonuclease Cas4